MKFSIIGIGKIKESWMKLGISEYTKRLATTGKIEFIELSEERIGSRPSSAELMQILDKEAIKLLKCIPDSACVVLLDMKGKSLSSEEFSKWIAQRMITGYSHFCFIIGGPYGNSDLLRKRADCCFCLGKITLTHQMARLITVEQIYRAMKIMKNEPYHL